jgi:hypothetical protein
MEILGESEIQVVTHPIHTRWSYAGTPSCSHTRMVWAVPLVALVEMW